MTKSKYETLDGLRGVAALAVVFVHGGSLAVGHLPSASLAVDLFFLMSGFVIAHAYEAKLLAGMSFARFMRVRLVRLYPLYIAGTMLTVSYLVLSRFVGHEPALIGFSELGRQTLFAIVGLPVPSADPGQPIFPLLFPAWSLFFEVLVNAAYAIFVRRLGTQTLWCILIASACALAVSTVHFGTLDVGWQWRTLVGGVPRVLFSFTAGVLLYRLKDTLPRFSVPPAAIVAAATALLAILPAGAFGIVYNLLLVLVGLPAVVALAIQNEPVRLRPLYVWGGAISYPLYALHLPLISWGSAAMKTVGVPMAWWLGALLIAGIVVAAWIASKIFDEPVRRALSPLGRKPLPGPAL